MESKARGELVELAPSNAVNSEAVTHPFQPKSIPRSGR
jgi:hypothetical protein